ncbi:MAG TPA: phosphotransferase, partial [Actinopolymorphaceae bacterium]
MRAGLEVLPATLLHGDVYGRNVLVPAEPGLPPRLIDWGSARIGPAMPDVALSAAEDSRGVAAYLRAWERLSDETVDPWLKAV